MNECTNALTLHHWHCGLKRFRPRRKLQNSHRQDVEFGCSKISLVLSNSLQMLLQSNLIKTLESSRYNKKI